VAEKPEMLILELEEEILPGFPLSRE